MDFMYVQIGGGGDGAITVFGAWGVCCEFPFIYGLIHRIKTSGEVRKNPGLFVISLLKVMVLCGKQ